MRLVFDIQSLQSASRLRGIGRYTHSLISALIAEHQEHEIILLVNAEFSDDHPRLVADLGLVPRHPMRNLLTARTLICKRSRE